MGPSSRDYAHSSDANERRFAKATDIVDTLQRGGWTFLGACRLTDAQRRIVTRCSGHKTASAETWTVALQLLRDLEHSTDDRVAVAG